MSAVESKGKLAQILNVDNKLVLYAVEGQYRNLMGLGVY